MKSHHRLLSIGRTAGLLGTAFIMATTSPAEAARRKTQSQNQTYSPPSAAMVVDVKTGRVLFSENADAPRIPASITKVMTLYLLFEQLESGNFRLDTPLKVTKYAASQPPSKLNIPAGGSIRVEDAIKALITRSANDVAVAIAENIAGTEANFARLMTQKARALGMNKTTFRNAHGLPANPPNVTTARDLTLLGRAIQDRFPRYYAYFGTRNFIYAGKLIGNHNKLLGRVEGVDGIKTGYTRASGFNLLTSLKVGNRQLVATVLGGRSGAQRDQRMEKLLAQALPGAHAGARRTALIVESPSVRKLASVGTRVASVSSQALPPSRPLSDTVPLRISKPSNLASNQPALASRSNSAASLPAALATENVTSRVLSYAEIPEPAPRPMVREALSTPLEKQALADLAATASSTTIIPERSSARPSGNWVIQIGASADEDKAQNILQKAKNRAHTLLENASPFTEKVMRGNITLYRARFSGFDTNGAQETCKKLKSSGFDCFATRG